MNNNCTMTDDILKAILLSPNSIHPPSPYKGYFNDDDDDDDDDIDDKRNTSDESRRCYNTHSRREREYQRMRETWLAEEGKEENNDEVGNEEEEEEEEEEEGMGEEIAAKSFCCGNCTTKCVGEPEFRNECSVCREFAYCSQKCKSEDTTKHLEKCAIKSRFKRVNACINAIDFSGTLSDVPGLEHDFLGGTTANVLLRMGPALSENVFLCEDKNGERTNVKLDFAEERKLGLLFQVKDDFEEVYLPICGVFLENLLPSDGNKVDIGIKYQTPVGQQLILYGFQRRGQGELERILI